jgi:hypothetical protein
MALLTLEKTMKKPHIFPLLLLSAAFTFLSCGVHDDAEIFIDWSSDNGGTLEVVNNSTTDIVLFHGQVPAQNSIMGGVRAGTTKNVDVSKYVPDFHVGGYMILRGMSRYEYNKNSLDLASAKIEFNAMATYGAGKKYRVSIESSYTGDYAVRIINRGRVGLELRKDSPEGEKVAYLPAFQQNQMLYTQNSNDITLFPYYVLYNNTTQTITTLKATSIRESIQASPRPASNSQGINTIYFPNDLTDTWEKIVGTLKSPVAYIRVTNNVMNQSAYFTNAGSRRYLSQEGYEGIASGERLTFEVEATEEGEQRQLILMYYGGTEQVPVLFEGETTPPLIENGYDYTVSVNQVGTGFTATIVKGKKRDLSDQLTSL